MPFRVPKLTLILQICKFEWGLLKEPLTSHVKIIERPWYWLTANTVQIMYIPNFYSYILGEFPDALHESSAIYWKPTPFITHLLLLWWLFPNAVQIFWKNTTKQLWRNWSQKMCKKWSVLLPSEPISECLESDEILMSVGICHRATLLSGLEGVLKPDLGSPWAPPWGCRPEKSYLFDCSSASLVPLSDWTPILDPSWRVFGILAAEI